MLILAFFLGCTPSPVDLPVADDDEDTDTPEVEPGSPYYRDEACVSAVPSPTCDHTVVDGPIQDALDDAAPGATVCVSAGRYVENLVVSKSVVLVATGPIEEVVLDGAANTVVDVEADNVRVEGFTITNGGTGVHVDGIDVVLVDLAITGNHGSGVRIDGGSVVVERTHLRFNYAPLGGGLSVVGEAIVAARRLVVTRNIADQAGGGLHVAADAVFTGQHVLVADNAAPNGGGLHATHGAVVDLRHAWFADNHSGDDGGGAALTWGASASLTNTVWIGNSAAENGGAIAARSSDVEVTNAAVVSNRANALGGGIHHRSTGGVWLTNVDLSENSARSGGGLFDVRDHRYSNLWANLPDPWAGDSEPCSCGTSEADPAYASADSHAPDLALSESSPLVDGGDPELLDADGTRSDVGPYGGPAGYDWEIDATGRALWCPPATSG